MTRFDIVWIVNTLFGRILSHRQNNNSFFPVFRSHFYLFIIVFSTEASTYCLFYSYARNRPTTFSCRRKNKCNFHEIIIKRIYTLNILCYMAGQCVFFSICLLSIHIYLYNLLEYEKYFIAEG